MITAVRAGVRPHGWLDRAFEVGITLKGLNGLLEIVGGLGSAVTFGAVYLLQHGVVKVMLVSALLLDRLWAYPWMIGVLTAFIGYQLYRIDLHPTVGLLALTVFDLLIMALTIREWRVQRRRLRR